MILGFSIDEIKLLYTISMMENESLFIIDDSPDNRLQNARQETPSNGPIFLNKFEGVQMEHDRRIRMTAAARNQMRMAEFGDINAERIAEIERNRIAQRKHDSRNRKYDDNNESRQVELDANCQRMAKYRRLAKDNLDIKHMKEREVLMEKVNQRYSIIFIYTDPFQDS
jgi:hypothetical protein